MRIQQLTEQPRRVAVIAFGRMNPPTIGHAKLVDAVKSQAGDPYIFLSQSQKPKTDPLSFEQKIGFAKAFFPGVTVGDPEVRTIFDALNKIYAMGYTDLVYVAGSDRVQQFTDLINKYNGQEDFYSFDSIQVVSAGERDPDAEGAEGMSASKMRAAATAGDFEAFKSGTPNPDMAQSMYDAVRTGMGMMESLERIVRVLETLTALNNVKPLNERVIRATGVVLEAWSEKYKRSINCNNPKGFSQRAHCQGRKKNESFLPNLDIEDLDKDAKRQKKLSTLRKLDKLRKDMEHIQQQLDFREYPGIDGDVYRQRKKKFQKDNKPYYIAGLDPEELDEGWWEDLKAKAQKYWNQLTGGQAQASIPPAKLQDYQKQFNNWLEPQIPAYAKPAGISPQLLRDRLKAESNFKHWGGTAPAGNKKPDPNKITRGDLGLKDKAVGLAQIRKPALDDVNRRHGTNIKPEELENAQTNLYVSSRYLGMLKNEYYNKFGKHLTDDPEAYAYVAYRYGPKVPDSAKKEIEDYIASKKKKEGVNEAFDTKVEWIKELGPSGSTVYATKVGDAYIELTYRPVSKGVYISFTRGGVMSVTGEGSQNKIFGAVINHIKQWAAKNKPEQIMFSAFKPRTGAFGSQDSTRSGLYRKMVQRFANQNGYEYDVEDTGNEDTFILKRQGVAEGLEKITEYRDRMYQYLKSIVPGFPDYVVKDWLYANFARGATQGPDWSFDTIGKDIPNLLKDMGLSVDTKWQLVPNMKFTMDMWEPKTLKRLQARAGGNSKTTDPDVHIPARDAERHATQAKLAQQQGGVRKEPVILIKTAQGYELLEGWHRTIQHFAMYPQGYTGPAYVAVAQGQQGVAEGKKTNKAFVKPQFDVEWEEAARYPEFQKIGKDAWIELAKKGKSVTIKSAKGINNTDAADPDSFKSLELEKQKRALAQLEKDTVEMPIVAVYSDGYKELIGGNTRLTAMMARDGKATVWAFKVPDEVAKLAENFAEGKSPHKKGTKKYKAHMAAMHAGMNESYKLQLERDDDLLVLHIKDTKTGKRTEVRGKPNYEGDGYDSDDKLHQLLDKIGKAANISELMNGEVVSINPNHPQGPSAKAHADKAFNEDVAQDLEAEFPGLYLDLYKTKAGYILGKIELPKEERGEGIGTRVMQRIVDIADSEGEVVALTPDTAFGASSKGRLEKFYKRFGFVFNKGRNKDYSFRETMIRYPKQTESISEAGVGRITKQNATKDAPIGSEFANVKKLGLGSGKPQELHAKARKNSDPNTLFNLGLTEGQLNEKGSIGIPLSSGMTVVIAPHRPLKVKKSKKKVKLVGAGGEE